MATFWDFFLTLPLYNRIFGPFAHRVDIIHSKLESKLEIVKFIYGCEALITVQLKGVDLYIMIFEKKWGMSGFLCLPQFPKLEY